MRWDVGSWVSNVTKIFFCGLANCCFDGEWLSGYYGQTDVVQQMFFLVSLHGD